MSSLLADGPERVEELASRDLNLAVVVTTGPTSEPQVSVVNAGMISHPVTAGPVAAFVARRGAKLRNLRLHPRATLVFRAGWEWVALRGVVELSGPDDPHPEIGPESRRELLREIYAAAGGHHPDLGEYDRVMLDERRCAVLVRPEHIWTNPSGYEHLEPGSRS